MDYEFLGKINSPDELKKLNKNETKTLCEEIRTEIISTVSKNGGHLASNLGAVELTVALHRAFNAPEDAIIFDVGHQSYTHKLLTGRADRFSTIRTAGGLSGYMKPSESEYDPFITGHSSNSVSAAYGIYKSKLITGEKGTAVAVIGDGAMTGGMAYEALNNCGNGRSNFIVVLNDNKMSISRNVGALARSFTKLRNRPKYHNFKLKLSHFLIKIPIIGKWLNNQFFRLKELFKAVIYRNNIFSDMGFNYLGPVDGHNIDAMEQLFNIAQTYTRPSLVHVITTKGKGYPYAETSPKSYHGVSPFDVELGADNSANKTFSDIAGETLCELAKSNNKICAVTAAMTTGTGLSAFASKYKSRFFDVGIAEQHAVTFSAGLSKGGAIPFFAVYSTFLQRAYDQIVHDCAIENLPVKLLIDRAGIVGEDGETHQGIFDLSFLSSIPNMNIYSPGCFNELSKLIKKTAGDNELCAIRYPRGTEPQSFDIDFEDNYTIFGSRLNKTVVVAFGRVFSNVYLALKDRADVTIIKLNRVFPIEADLIKLLLNFKTIYFFEEGIKSGGIAEHLGAKLVENNFSGSYKITAINDEFVPSNNVASSLKCFGLDAESIKNTVV